MDALTHPELQHKHVIIRAEVTNPPTNPDATSAWFAQLIKDMGMEIMMGPYVAYHEQVGNRGLTGVAVITTSHLALHCWDESNPAVIQFDVYTCGAMNLDVVFDSLAIYEPVKIQYKYIDREKDLTNLHEGYHLHGDMLTV